mmetsp:Transcript_31609/g.48388  ORF Transcript_31609/g.48388 Transcript_31609/m.48388 type:complete len:258 (-) Transcript_31609:401-1174(-)
MSSTEERQQGTVKWFSNKKGYGFIQPNPSCPVQDDIFVHQTAIHSDGFRTLSDGWMVEFTLGKDDTGKIKADDVTAPGGGPCTGPRPPRRRRQNRDDEDEEDGTEDDTVGDQQQDDQQQQQDAKAGGRRGRGGGRAGGNPGRGGRGGRATNQTNVLWHSNLEASVVERLKANNIRCSTGTIDISVDKARVKLGTRGYASSAHADKYLAEGQFVHTPEGQVTFTWERCIQFDADEWKPVALDQIQSVFVPSLNLTDGK